MIVPKNDICQYRVSSVMNRDVKNFGKCALFDGNDDTCWNSDKGSPQWIYVEFVKDLDITGINLQFQGGFAGHTCRVTMKTSSDQEFTEDFYPEDNNTKQTFTFAKPYTIKRMEIYFNDSTDFFGRIVVYKLEIHSLCLK